MHIFIMLLQFMTLKNHIGSAGLCVCIAKGKVICTQNCSLLPVTSFVFLIIAGQNYLKLSIHQKTLKTLSLFTTVNLLRMSGELTPIQSRWSKSHLKSLHMLTTVVWIGWLFVCYSFILSQCMWWALLFLRINVIHRKPHNRHLDTTFHCCPVHLKILMIVSKVTVWTDPPPPPPPNQSKASNMGKLGRKS